MNPERILDVIGTLEGTNKSSLYHDYLYAYENVLRPLRQEHFTLLEIGVYDGASLRMWKNYFPHAKIVGIDINPACADLAAERIAVEIGSQDDPEFLDRVMQQYRPLVVIDDGSHLAHHIISSFERIFPLLAKGGIYIIEDAAFHIGDTAARHMSLAKISLPDYFMSLAHNNMAAGIDAKDNHGLGKYLFDHLESVGFSKGAIVMRKASERLDGQASNEVATAFVEASPSPMYWAGLAGVLFAKGGPWNRAEQAIRNAISLDAGVATYHYRLAEILQRQNRFDEAIAAAVQALESPGGWFIGTAPGNVWYTLGVLYQQKGDHRNAVESFGRAVAYSPEHAPNRDALSFALERFGALAEAIVQAEHAARLSAAGSDADTRRARLDALKQRQAAEAPGPTVA